jgi:hypothetical protein
MLVTTHLFIGTRIACVCAACVRLASAMQRPTPETEFTS